MLTFLRQYKYISKDEQDYESSIINFFLFIFDVALYAFTLDPNVSHSITFAKIILFIDKFITQKENLVNYQERLRHPISNALIALLDKELDSRQASQIERLNILLVLYSLDSEIFKKIGKTKLKSYIFGKKINGMDELYEFDYFNLIVALFIFRNDIYYKDLKAETIKEIEKKLIGLKSIKYSSEACHLYFDCMSCPFLEDTEKISITKNLLQFHNISQSNLFPTANDWVNFLKNKNWFVTWNEVDFLNYLRRKQLRDAY